MQKTFRLFGLNLETSFPFSFPLPLCKEPADLTFRMEPGVRTAEPIGRPAPLYSSPWREDEGESVAQLYRLPEAEVFTFSRAVEFRLEPGRIAAALLHEDYEYLVELRLLGPVLSYWLERQGLPTLHASAVEVEEQAVGFISSHHGGKSGLAAAFVQDGQPLLTDDILPIEESAGIFLGRSGYPQMRMWPDEAAHFLGGYEDLPLVHPHLAKRRVAIGGEDGWGRFQESALSLAALYVPERREGGPIEIEPLSRSAAVIELVRQSFSPHLVQAVGLQPARLDLFARLVRQIPVRRLLYPSGFERLPEVVEAIRRDLISSPENM